MNILIINQNWFANEFREAGHNVLTCGMAQHLDVAVPHFLIHIDSLISSLPSGFIPDRIVVHDESAPIMISGLEQTSIPTIFYAVDTHHHHELHVQLYDLFDHMFIAQPDYLCHFEPFGYKPEWLPLWASQQVEPSTEKKYGAIFMGTLNPELNSERVKFFEELQKLVPITVMQGHFPHYFPCSEIVVNQTVKGDVNFRVFESMMCGPLLLTERSGNGLLEMFRDREHLVTYEKGNVREAADLITYYLAHQDECRRIAQAGHQEVLQRHLPIHRAKRFLQVLEALQKRSSPRRFLSAVANYVTLGLRLERKGHIQAVQAYVCAMTALEQALIRNEPLEDKIAVHCVMACLRYDHLLVSEAGQGVLEQLARRHPQIAIISLSYIRMLLNRGERAAAEAHSRHVSNQDSDRVFRAAEDVVQVLLQDLNNSGLKPLNLG